MSTPLCEMLVREKAPDQGGFSYAISLADHALDKGNLRGTKSYHRDRREEEECRHALHAIQKGWVSWGKAIRESSPRVGNALAYIKE